MTAVCSRCQADLAPDVLDGLCPRCLLHQALPLELTGDADPPNGLFRPPAPAELAALFPNLEVQELLGQGGMGAVYRARQVKLDRPVALKVLPPAVAEDPSFAERFLREARALARLSHPHIVAVHDFGDVNGLYYLVMEFVDGVNLRQALAHGRLTPRQALAIVGQLCSALQYAHEMGVIHRDIKPENVLLDRQGNVKVADFGLAKLVGPTRSAERLTGTWQVMGTPHYMAPEQVEKPTAVDHRADIYSLGVVFYEVLTGELPLGKFPLPSQKAGVDVRLDGVVLRAMEKEPDQRYQKMRDMKTDVEAAGQVAHPEAETPPQAATDYTREALITAGMVVLVSVAIAGFWLLGSWVGFVGVREVSRQVGNSFVTERYDSGLLKMTLLTLTFLGLCGLAYTPLMNRNLRRLVSLTVLAAVGVSMLVLLTGVSSPFGQVLHWWFLATVWSTPFQLRQFVSSFRPDGATPAEEPPDVPLPYLQPREEALLRLLQAEFHKQWWSWTYQVLPEFDNEVLVSARRICEVPPDEHILGFLDLGDGEATTGLAFGCRGLYWRNSQGTQQPGPGTLAYPEMVQRQFVNHGDRVYLGNGQFLCPDIEDGGPATEELIELLYRVRGLLAPAEPDNTGGGLKAGREEA
jgi:predicted Ser/Thr protein kinase